MSSRTTSTNYNSHSTTKIIIPYYMTINLEIVFKNLTFFAKIILEVFMKLFVTDYDDTLYTSDERLKINILKLKKLQEKILTMRINALIWAI